MSYKRRLGTEYQYFFISERGTRKLNKKLLVSCL